MTRVSEKAHTNILLVDPDRITFLVLKQAFVRVLGLTLAHAETGTEALELLSKKRFDLVVSETELPDMDGPQLFKRLGARGPVPAHLFLTADARKAPRLSALSEGAVDYIQKPCDPDELRIRALGIIARAASALVSNTKGGEILLEGSLETLSLPDLLSVLSMAGTSGHLSVRFAASAQGEALIDIKDGSPQSAVFGAKTGLDAMYALLAEAPVGTFALVRAEPGGTRSIHVSINEILLEGARLHDERSLEVSSPVMRRISSSGTASMVRGNRVFAPIPTLALAKRFLEQLEDPFVLGELHLMTPEVLATWTRRTNAGVRLHVWLVSDMARGARSMLELASPVSELLLVSSMGSAPKVLGLTFLLRDELELDVLLIDPRQATLFAPELVRTPSFAILANGPGTSASAYVSVQQLLAFLSVDLLLSTKREASVLDWKARPKPKSRPPQMCEVTIDAAIDLRALLIEALRAWGSLTQASVAPKS
jgi:CheY-like chemotaxis protein